MLTHLRLILAQLIAPSGYEVANFDYAQSTATNCYFRGKYEVYHLLRSTMDNLYGTDWSDSIYYIVKHREEYYSNLLNNPSNEPDFEE